MTHANVCFRSASVVCVLLSVSVFGQTQSTVPQAPPPQPAPPPPPRVQQSSDYDMLRGRQSPLHFEGKVVMEDGSPAPEGVAIDSIGCGSSRRVAFTGRGGRFSISLGAGTDVLVDARVARPVVTGVPELHRSSQSSGLCDLRASWPGYRSSVLRSTTVERVNRIKFDPSIGTIILYRDGTVRGTTFSSTSRSAPKQARKAFEKAVDAAERGKSAQSSREFEKAVRLYPQYAEAWFELGRSLESQGRLAEARTAYEKARLADRTFVSPDLRLAGMAAGERNWREVAVATSRVLELNAVDFPEAHYFHAVASFNLGDLKAAGQSALAAIRLDEQRHFPKASDLLSLIRARTAAPNP